MTGSRIIKEFYKRYVCPEDGPFHNCKHQFDFLIWREIIAPFLKELVNDVYNKAFEQGFKSGKEQKG